jgi:BlaI family transcriptional regulator, penicillinase repressor
LQHLLLNRWCMGDDKLAALSNRERQIVDILFKREVASAREIWEDMPDAPGYSAMRSMLSRLVEKEVLTAEMRNGRLLYRGRFSRKRAQNRELQRLVDKFFGGSAKAAIIGLLGDAEDDLSAQDMDEITRLLRKKKNPGGAS